MKDEKEPQDLRERTRQFALCIVKLYVALPKSTEAQVLGKQVLRSGTSVGAHYREAHRAKSEPDFVNKIERALQDLDETAYWLELLAGAKIVSTERLIPLCKEADELTAICAAIVKKVKSR